jgi:cytoskeletal protein CcmA (bactofilin family)
LRRAGAVFEGKCNMLEQKAAQSQGTEADQKDSADPARI